MLEENKLNLKIDKSGKIPKKSQTNKDFKTLFLFLFFAILGLSAFAIDDTLSELVNETFENINLNNLSEVLTNLNQKQDN